MRINAFVVARMRVTIRVRETEIGTNLSGGNNSMGGFFSVSFFVE
jgi:hypothetical protein